MTGLFTVTLKTVETSLLLRGEQPVNFPPKIVPARFPAGVPVSQVNAPVGSKSF